MSLMELWHKGASLAEYDEYLVNYDLVGKPLTAPTVVYTSVVIYLCTLLFCKYVVVDKLRGGKPFGLQKLFIVHNIVLSIGSGLVLLGFVIELTRLAAYHVSPWDLFCDASPTSTINVRGRLIFLYYINYFFKYVELLDTVLLVLRGRTPKFLHVYHHAATLVLSWSQGQSETPMSWFIVSFNLAIHVIMYAYYAGHAMGYRFWWKRYLTSLQIVQFISAIVVCVWVIVARVVGNATGNASLQCHGDQAGHLFGTAILASYLLLFIQLYRNNYQTPKAVAAAPATTTVTKTPRRSTKKKAASTKKKSPSSKKKTPARSRKKSSPKSRAAKKLA